MSKLFHSEHGFCHYLHYEAVSARRRVRKTLMLPERVEAGGTLYLLARPFPGCAHPLLIALNGQEFSLQPAPTSCLAWHTLPVPREALCPGENEIELWCNNAALDGWALAMETGYPPATSRLSLDGGRTWRSERMGISHALSGEYLVRLRVDDPALCDPVPPAFIWENLDCRWFDAVQDAVPAEIRHLADPWERARALAAWVSTQWQYRNTGTGIEYAPWDALTILSWGRADHGFVQPHPITMCVHYGIVYTTCALALGIPARSICCKGSGLHDGGHFISEVWSERWQKWCQVDGNTDVVFMRDGVPLSVAELAVIGREAEALAITGPGYAQQNDYIKKFVRDYMFSGRVYEHWAVWPRNDYLSHPELTPPAHGSPEYSETEWIWAEPAKGAENQGMFPYRLPVHALGTAPEGTWRAMAEIAR